MFNQVERGKRLAAKAERNASRVAFNQGLHCEPDGGRRRVKLGRRRAVVENVTFVDRFDGSRRPAPPKVIEADPEAFTEGTLDELRCRLAVIATLEALVGDDVGIDEVAAALDFLRDSGVALQIYQTVAEIDFLAWRVLTGDLGAWFALRFVQSRISAV